ncbi:MAG TPA: hypothetical protein VGB91_13560 [Rhizomicrobium sp.]
MRNKFALLACAATIAIGTGAAYAQMPDPPPDTRGYYNPDDHQGYYDRDGHYRHFPPGQQFETDEDDSGPPPPPPGPPPGARYDRDDGPGGYREDSYREGDYERQCRNGTAAGTVFGAAGGGLIGGAASRGNPAAIIGGIFLGGLLGNALSHDIDCDDQRYAFDQYAVGLNGDIGQRYEWRHGEAYGYFTPTREFSDDGQRCREFTAVTYRHGEEYRHNGTACYQRDGNWHFRD